MNVTIKFNMLKYVFTTCSNLFLTLDKCRYLRNLKFQFVIIDVTLNDFSLFKDKKRFWIFMLWYERLTLTLSYFSPVYGWL